MVHADTTVIAYTPILIWILSAVPLKLIELVIPEIVTHQSLHAVGIIKLD